MGPLVVQSGRNGASVVHDNTHYKYPPAGKLLTLNTVN